MPLGKGTLPGGYPVINSTTTLDEIAEAVSKMPEPQPPPSPSPTPRSAERTDPYHRINECCVAFNRAQDEATEKGMNSYSANNAGRNAYRRAMPPLVGSKNIRDFVACVTHAMVIDIMPHEHATPLLNAAKVALSAHLRRHKRRPISNQSNKIEKPKTEKL